MVIVSVFSFGGAWVLYRVTNWILPLRVNRNNEIRGLDENPHWGVLWGSVE